jgi:hypothetical protein
MTRFSDLLRALSEAQVEFILIGGVAAAAHGSPRATQDIDIVYARSRENLRRVAKALAPLSPSLRGAPPGLPFRLDVPTRRRPEFRTKRAAGRPKDFEAIAELEILRDRTPKK